MANQIDRQKLGAKIREAREYLGYSQDDVAVVLKVPRTAISLIESGQRKLDAIELQRLAQFLEKPVAFFTEELPQLTKARADVVALARLASKLTPGDLGELKQFAAYLESRAATKRTRNT